MIKLIEIIKQLCEYDPITDLYKYKKLYLKYIGNIGFVLVGNEYIYLRDINYNLTRIGEVKFVLEWDSFFNEHIKFNGNFCCHDITFLASFGEVLIINNEWYSVLDKEKLQTAILEFKDKNDKKKFFDAIEYCTKCQI